MDEKSNNEQRGKQALRDLEKELNARDRKESGKPWIIAAASVAVLAVAGGGIYFLATQNDDEQISASDEASTSEETSSPELTDAEPIALSRTTALPATVTCKYDEQSDKGDNFDGLPPTDNISTQGMVTVNLDTSAGPIGMTLDRSVAPCTVNAVEFLAEKHYFDDTVCHRLTNSDGLKVLQCGDPTGTGSGGPGFEFANEYPTDEALDKVDTSQIPDGTPDDQVNQYKQTLLQQNLVTYPRGTIAMANAGLDTNGSQFFLNYGDSTLAPAYTYFGTIDDEGLDTLDAIADKGIDGDQTDGAPKDEVRIKSAKVA